MKFVAVLLQLALLIVLGLIYEVLLRMAAPVTFKRVPDAEQGVVCYVSSRGHVSCVTDYHYRVIAAVPEVKTE